MSVTLHCHQGSIEAEIGDRFGWWDGTEWEIVSLTGERMYSPSGLGGTPIIQCKHLDGKLAGPMLQYTDANGLCEWCGDSVGAALFQDFRGNRKAVPTNEVGARPSSRATPNPHPKAQ